MTTEEKRKQLMIAGIERKRLHKQKTAKRKKRIASFSIACVFAFSAFSAFEAASAKEITITEINEFEGKNESKTIKTHDSKVSGVLDKNGLKLGDSDKINISVDSSLKDNTDIVITRGKKITIKTPEEEKAVTITKADTNDALIEAGYTPGENDEIKTNGNTLADSDVIEVVTVTAENRTVESDVSFDTEYVDDPDMYEGDTRLVKEGVKGTKTTYYKVTYKNGTETDSDSTSEEVTKEPVNRVIARGTKKKATASPSTAKPSSTKSASTSAAAQANDSGKTINGMSYSKKITMTATAYTTQPSENGGYTVSAMGNSLRRGIVAIDPSVVPLGSKVYVTSTDGSWVYGTASAEDTGGAIKGNRIDLCMGSSMAESDDFGRRSCIVYILN